MFHFSFSILRYYMSVIFLFLVIISLTGCSGIAKGITEAVIGDSSKQDTKKCYIRGRPFAGLKTIMTAERDQQVTEPKSLKILMVHGIGTHAPGYSTRLAENLAVKLRLNRIDEQTKELKLTDNAGSERELGILRLNRYMSTDFSQELVFAELTWDPIVEKEKQGIAFDNSGEYSFRRTTLNNSLKEFVNATIPDVLMYNGSSRLPIQLAIGQSMCWLMNERWGDIPERGKFFCDGNGPKSLSRIQDDFVFITHSLGSRITVDALQLIASAVSEKALTDPSFVEKMRLLHEKEFTVFMLSNQLPLLQLGRPEPGVTGKIRELCGSKAVKQEQRMFKETKLIAFSDPNDLFSYAIPGTFLDEHMDSRLCPSLTNVIINVADVVSLFGGELANPLSAHTNYDNDERVLGLLTKGIGGIETDPSVKKNCTWLETVPNYSLDGQK